MKSWKILHGGKGESVKGEEIVKILLENRGVKTKKEIEEFLNPNLDRVTLASVGIDEKEVKKALDRIKRAVKNNEGIVIYGDYDVDGVCATAILWETIYSFYKQSLPPSEIKNVHPYIPHRVDEGYGLSSRGISNIQSQMSNVKLIITVDNGIVANKAVEYAEKLGIDVIITDHHVKGKLLPKACSIIHTTELCGTGIAYLLAKAISNFQFSSLREKSSATFSISKQFTKQKFSNEENHLELVALATVADLVPLNKYNRALLKFGLEKLRKTKRLGLVSLFEEAVIKQNEIDTYHIGHMIAPRINASGRISHALDSLRLICTTDNTRAKKLAKLLGDINKERQQLTFSSAEHAKSTIHDPGSKIENLVFVQSETYDQGVIGLIASRLVEEFYRPAIAVSVGSEFSKGSARSISGVNIIELIRSVPEFLAEAGGHPMAAGFSVETKNLEKFKKKLVNQANKIIDKKLFVRKLTIDLELEFNFINLQLYKTLQTLSPFGMGNPTPVFMTKNVTIVSFRKVGKDGAHVQIFLQKDGINFKGILFKFNSDKIKIGDTVDIAYTIEKNEWNGKTSIELKIKDLKETLTSKSS